MGRRAEAEAVTLGPVVARRYREAAVGTGPGSGSTGQGGSATLGEETATLRQRGDYASKSRV